jgi:hypothetical protein
LSPTRLAAGLRLVVVVWVVVAVWDLVALADLRVADATPAPTTIRTAAVTAAARALKRMTLLLAADRHMI